MRLYGYRDLRARGMSREGIAAALRTGELRRVLRDVYAEGEVRDRPALRAAAIRAQRTRTEAAADAIAYLRTAAWLHGLDALPPGRSVSDWPLQVVVPPPFVRPRGAGCKGYVAELGPNDVTRIDGVRVTTALRTALDCARLLPRLEGQATIDQFVHRDPALLPGLREQAELYAGRRGAKRLRDAVELTDPRIESPGESWTRVVMVAGKLPVPEPQVEISGPDGATWARLDNGYRAYRVAVEYDGQQFHSGRDAAAHDEGRRRVLEERYGWVVLVAHRGHIWSRSAELVAGIWQALLGRGYESDGGVPEREELVRIFDRSHRDWCGSEYLPAYLDEPT